MQIVRTSLLCLAALCFVIAVCGAQQLPRGPGGVPELRRGADGQLEVVQPTPQGVPTPAAPAARARPARPAAPPTPAQCSAVGYKTLVAADSFATNEHVDIATTEAPGFGWYLVPVSTGAPANMNTNITNDGTGLQLLDVPGTAAQGLQTAGYSANPPYWVGTTFTGGFCASLEMKFNPVTQGSQVSGNDPAFWLMPLSHFLNGKTPEGFPYTELDFFECVAGPAGSPCSPGMFANDWYYNAGKPAYWGNANSRVTLPGNPALGTYNTYMFRWLPAATHGGTGEFDYYFNPTINPSPVISIKYTATGRPSSGCGACPNGTYFDIESQGPNLLIIGAGVRPWSNTVRNFAVWQ